jgi:DNA mismatch endonuclease (patch repair protein)
MSRIHGQGNKRTETDVIKLLRKVRIKGWRRHQTICFNESNSRRAQSSDGIKFKAQVRPDFVFPKTRVALFIDGCFWHGCPKCYRTPKSRKRFWSAKVLRNKERDTFQTFALKQTGWRVIRIWECSLNEKSFELLKRTLKLKSPAAGV